MAASGKLERVVAELEARIEGTELVSGQRLVEADLTRELGVSRPLLREAFRHLASEGAIAIVPHRGAEVRRLSRREALELFEIRLELEAMAARRAASAMADPNVERAFRAATAPLLDADRPPAGAAEYIAENEAFHRAIFTASGNATLADLARKMRLPLILSQLRGAFTPDILAASLAEHRAIAAAILDGDSAAAERSMRAHLARATILVAEVPERFFAAGDTRP